MALTAIKPRDNSKEELERYKRDLEDKEKNPHKWAVVRRPEVQAILNTEAREKAKEKAVEESKPKKVVKKSK